jgi:hypothetical protein
MDVLRAAAQERRVLVTFDVSTIPTLLYEMALASEDHPSVVFASFKTFRQDDVGGLAHALELLSIEMHDADTTNLTRFLVP